MLVSITFEAVRLARHMIGAHLATDGGDGTACTFTMQIVELVGLAQSRLTRTPGEEECRQYLPGEQDLAAP
jgi:hypothetical protein